MMQADLNKAKALLESGGYTCVLVQGGKVYSSVCRGVKPLLDWHESAAPLEGFCAADKVVGKAAALLYVLLGVKAVYAGVISKPALAVLQQHGIEATYGVLEEAIRDRAGTGFCPMEQATREITDPNLAPAAIRQTLARLKG